jgi:hypothetical protein
MTSDRDLDLMYERYTDKLIEENFGDNEPEEEYWDEAAEDRALDKWRGLE